MYFKNVPCLDMAMKRGAIALEEVSATTAAEHATVSLVSSERDASSKPLYSKEYYLQIGCII